MLVAVDGRTVIFDRAGNDGGVYSAAIDGSGVKRLVEGHDSPGAPMLTAGKAVLAEAPSDAVCTTNPAPIAIDTAMPASARRSGRG